jgi:hypothetical protein
MSIAIQFPQQAFHISDKQRNGSIHQNKYDAAGLRSVVNPGMICRLLDWDIASLHVPTGEHF